METLTSWNPLVHSRPVTGLIYLYNTLSPCLFCIQFSINCLIHIGFPTGLFQQSRMHCLVNHYSSLTWHVERRKTCGEVQVSSVIKRIVYIFDVKPKFSEPKLAIHRIQNFTSTNSHTFDCLILFCRVPICKSRRPSLQMLYETRSYLIRVTVT